jgi:hypothetical protein
VRHSRTLSNEELAYVHAEQALAKVSSTRTGEHAFTLSCASTQPSDTRTLLSHSRARVHSHPTRTLQAHAMRSSPQCCHRLCQCPADWCSSSSRQSCARPRRHRRRPASLMRRFGHRSRRRHRGYANLCE